ncbi:hypothetical protein, partial [Serratia marcescens]|uniref:hypothetical protein n=1 Tax=Serratia marcescens TaxID=615 RepID=UPI001F045E11
PATACFGRPFFLPRSTPPPLNAGLSTRRYILFPAYSHLLNKSYKNLMGGNSFNAVFIFRRQ